MDNSWSGPANYILKGVMYVDENVGFFCYNYAEGMDGNLYMTKDGGKTFSKVTLPEQELDSTAKSSTASSTVADDELKWNDVYKEALVPTVDDKGIITVYLTQVLMELIMMERRRLSISHLIKVIHGCS